MKVKNLIIGAGISGLTVANYCDGDYLIIEKDDEPGGYCRTHRNGEFVWDYAGHFFHFKTDEFKKKILNKMSENEIVMQSKKTYVYIGGEKIDYPFQMNIHQLPKEKFIDCLYDLFNKVEKDKYDNFLDMLYGKFGRSITEMFLKPYNEKLYACDLKLLDTNAMGRFFPYADIPAIIKNMKISTNTSYNDVFIYPKEGAQAIIDILLENINKEKILTKTTVNSVDIKNRIAKLSNGDEVSYVNLINTIPFNRFLDILGSEEYGKFGHDLSYNKTLVFNIGFNKKSAYNSEHWIYFPEKEINFYRLGFYDNILDTDKTSVYVEIGYDKNASIDDDEIEHQFKLTLENLRKVGVIDESFEVLAHENIIMDPAYVHIEVEHDKKVRNILQEFSKENVYSIGRYGAWTYCSMEDCMVAAKELCAKIKEGKHE